MEEAPMTSKMLPDLIDQLRTGQVTRRGFVRRASALGLSTAAAGILAQNALAQDASPAASPSASPGASPVAGAITSITREEYNAALREAFPLEEAASTGGQIIHVSTTDIRTLNPQLVTDTYSGYITGYVYEYLAGGSPIDGTPVPGLADYWELADDGVTYTFYINENATWHDGNPVTADDVIFSFDSIMAEDTLSVRRSDVALALKEWKKVDDKTVQLIGHEPFATFIENTAVLVGIVPKHIWESVPVADWGSDAGSTGTDPSRVIGSGPFTFVEWAQGDHVTIRRNDNYWDTQNLPVIDEYIIRVIADAASAVASLQTGEADVTEIENPQVGPLRESNPELNIVEYDTTSFNYFYTNQDPSRVELFTDIPVRQALLYALDRDLMAETIYQGFAIRADGTQPVLSIAYNPDAVETIYNFDPDQAGSLLEGAGWVDSDGDGIREKDGVKLSFECFYAEAVATYEQQIPYMQQSWRDVGIEMIPSAIPFPTLIDNAIAGNFQMNVAGFSWSVDGGQGTMFRCDATPPDGFNRMRYCNEEYDALDDQQLRELDVDKRIDLLTQQSNIVNNEAVVGITVFSKGIMGGAPHVHNFIPNGYSDVWWVQYAWVDQ
jgi:peptide/nickel transport system substrate-binding protein